MELSLNIIEILLIISAYLLGSLCSAIIVCKLLGLKDPRSEGSKNPGATNVKRLHGTKIAAVVLAGDLLKGLIPVAVANIIGINSLAVFLIGSAVFIGHLFPIFANFKGGKGLATMLGVMFGLSLWVGLAVTATWIFFTKAIKNSALSVLMSASMVAVLAPIYIYIFTGNIIWVVGGFIMSVILLIRHKSNFYRVIQKTEL